MRDVDIRLGIYSKVLKDHIHEPDTLVLNEYKISDAKAIADIAVVNGCITGYEIKSAADNLKRLPANLSFTLNALTLSS